MPLTPSQTTARGQYEYNFVCTYVCDRGVLTTRGQYEYNFVCTCVLCGTGVYFHHMPTHGPRVA